MGRRLLSSNARTTDDRRRNQDGHRLFVFDPWQPRRHFVDQWLAKLDELASCALIQAKILAFNRFITIADRYLLRRQATVVQQSTAQSATENGHPSACFRPRFSPPRLPDRLSSPNVAKEAVPDTESCGHQCLCR